MDTTTSATSLETFVQAITDRFIHLTRNLGAWVEAEPRSLQQLEEHLLAQLHQLGNALLTGLLSLAAVAPPATITCLAPHCKNCLHCLARPKLRLLMLPLSWNGCVWSGSAPIVCEWLPKNSVPR